MDELNKVAELCHVAIEFFTYCLIVEQFTRIYFECILELKN